MADVNTEQEPSIEEILESIRQIISDDEGGAEEEVKAEEKPKPAPVAAKPAPTPAPKKAEPPKPIENIDAATEDDIIDLVEIVDTSVPEPEPEPDPVPLDLTPPEEDKYDSDLVLTGEDEESLLSDNTANAATDAMAKLLAGNVAVERQVVGRPGNVTLEDMARELMRPLIKTWLDQNLPAVIERVVAKEVEKISRRAMDK